MYKNVLELIFTVSSLGNKLKSDEIVYSLSWYNLFVSTIRCLLSTSFH